MNHFARRAQLWVAKNTRLTHNMAVKRDPANAAIPRLSASLIVINQRNEILLVHRNPKSSAFAGVHVFPGGNYDEKQDRGSLQMTAIRETFEETGLLLASPARSSRTGSRGRELSDAELDAARERVHAQKEMFGEFLEKCGLSADVDELMSFTRWTTPANQPRRFQTQFYVTFLSGGGQFTSGNKLDRLPTPDGGQEVISARFVHPSDILLECARREITLMPPQFYLVSTLEGLIGGGERVGRMGRGAFGRMGFCPMPMSMKSGPGGVGGPREGWTWLTYEGDETRGGRKGRVHRSMVKFERPGVISGVELFRNFDVYDEAVVEEIVREGTKL
ncbi:hypothetical protein BC835DRAFT_1395834 [Cytidiella melzeri]|nr:hypothetical protein BC835DRAFT_1395834 [Cytidiella melzeri]